jgi:anaerobic magnesium-protoporphyrin IX monomethyl ester cyclase
MKVALVNPNIEMDLELFHLGLAAVGSAVNATVRHQAEVVDFTFHWNEWQSYLRERLERQRPHVVGIATLTPRVPSMLKVAAAVRNILPAAVIVVGGQQATLDARRTVSRSEVDLALVGEADFTFPALLDALEDATPLEAVPSLVWKRDGEVVANAPGELPSGEAFEKLPFWDWSLWEQVPRMIRHVGYLPVQGVRGCAYQCSFCTAPIMAERMGGPERWIRYHRPERTVEEATWLWERHRAQGLRYLFFYDLNFLHDLPWLRGFASAYRAAGLNEKLPFSAYSRVEHINEETLDLARSAGCVQLRVGIEAGDPHFRNEALNKELPEEELRLKMALLRRSGIRSLGYYMFGAPGETLLEARRSVIDSLRHGMDRAAFFYFTPLHGLPIMEKAGLDVDYFKEAESSGFYRGSTQTRGRRRLQALFMGANGYWLARTFARQARRQGPRWVAGFPAYLREAAADGLPPRLATALYVLYHGDSFLW